MGDAICQMADGRWQMPNASMRDGSKISATRRELPRHQQALDFVRTYWSRMDDTKQHWEDG